MWENVRKASFFCKVIRKLLILGPESSIFQSIRKTFFGENITKECVYFLFLFFELGLKNDPGSPIIHYYSGYDFVLESFSLNL